MVYVNPIRSVSESYGLESVIHPESDEFRGNPIGRLRVIYGMNHDVTVRGRRDDAACGAGWFAACATVRAADCIPDRVGFLRTEVNNPSNFGRIPR